MGVLGQSFAVGDVEPQVVPLVWRRVLVLMDQDDETDGPLDRDGDVRTSDDGHAQSVTLHGNRGVTGQHQAVLAVQDDLAWGDLDVGPPGSLHHHNDAAEVGALLLSAVSWRWGPN